MRIVSRVALASALIAFFSAVPAGAAQPAAAYPVKPIRLIIANTTGTSVDTLSRILAVRMGDAMGQQMVTDNRGGAGGTIGAELAAHAAPDGYTLLLTSTGVQVISPQLYKKLGYHPVRDFAPISQFAVTQNILVVNPALTIRSVADLLAQARAQHGKLNMANAGSGFQSHLAGVLFTHMAKIDVLHVPYKGGASLTAVIANEAQFTIAPGPALMGHVRGGRLRALATGGEKRSILTPELPTIAESGVPGFISTGWAGLMAPLKTPKPILDKLHATLLKVIADPVTRELLERQGGEPVTSAPAQFAAFIAQEHERFRSAIRIARLDVQ